MINQNILSGIADPKYRRREDIEKYIHDEFLSKPDRYPEHQHLNNAMLHVYTIESLNAKGYERYGKIKYISDDLMFILTGIDFLLILNEEIWDSTPDIRRKAIIDHFLFKVKAQYEWECPETQKVVKGEFDDIPKDPGINLRFQTTKSGRFRWKIVKPIGEFPEIIKRYGGWNVDVQDIKNSFNEN